MTVGAFWAFSLRFYDAPGVPSACIELQDRHGANVGVLLFVLWCGSRGHRMEVSELDAADIASAPWHDLVVSIRQVRRGMRPVPGSPYDEATVMQLKRHLLSAELEAERLQHEALEALARPPGIADPAEAARSNLVRYAERIRIPTDAAPLAVLRRAAS